MIIMECFIMEMFIVGKAYRRKSHALYNWK